MNLDRESPGSAFVGDCQDDNPLPAGLSRYRPEVKLPPESWWVRAVRIAVVAIIACWIVAGIVIFIVR
ncbi:MAG: hypothetical protein K2Z80_04535 [Xanthobacteraceae bacterium]|nr:hypothetical protein [Xanthobacteraceae bacterium]